MRCDGAVLQHRTFTMAFSAGWHFWPVISEGDSLVLDETWLIFLLFLNRALIHVK